MPLRKHWRRASRPRGRIPDVGTGPPPSSPAVRRRMQLQRSRDTVPELALRRLLHAQGLRYRVHRTPVAGLRRVADIVFGPARTVVEVRGCFWHACPEHGTRPRSNAEWWAAKLERTRRRGAETEALLRNAGWHVIVVWEHEDPVVAAERIAAVVRVRRPGRVSQPVPTLVPEVR